MSKSSPAAIAAATWALCQDDAGERRRLIDGHGARRVDVERGGLIITDHTAADEWLIRQHEAARL